MAYFHDADVALNWRQNFAVSIKIPGKYTTHTATPTRGKQRVWLKGRRSQTNKNTTNTEN